MKRFIALLRGVNVSGHNKVPMAELREACAELGWQDVTTYINSGNVIFGAKGKPEALETALEAAIQKAFKLTIPVVVRSVDEWRALADSNPFLEACKTQANLVMLCLTKKPLRKEVVVELGARATAGEKIERAGEALWIHFPAGVGRSKLTPASMDKAAGSPLTARNWRTVQKLLEL